MGREIWLKIFIKILQFERQNPNELAKRAASSHDRAARLLLLYSSIVENDIKYGYAKVVGTKRKEASQSPQRISVHLIQFSFSCLYVCRDLSNYKGNKFVMKVLIYHS